MTITNNYHRSAEFARTGQDYEYSLEPPSKMKSHVIVRTCAGSGFGVFELIFAIFFYKRHSTSPVDRIACHQIVSYIYAEYGAILRSTQFEMRSNLIFNREVDEAIHKLVSMSCIESAENDAYRITQSGLWQYDSSIAPKIIRCNTVLIPVISGLKLILRKLDACPLERAGPLHSISNSESASKEAEAFDKTTGNSCPRCGLRTLTPY
jgi:hypothetical protein